MSDLSDLSEKLLVLMKVIEERTGLGWDERVGIADLRVAEAEIEPEVLSALQALGLSSDQAAALWYRFAHPICP